MFEDTERALKSGQSKKGRQSNGNKKRDKTMIYETLHRKPEIKEYVPHQKPGANSGAPEGITVQAPLETPY